MQYLFSTSMSGVLLSSFHQVSVQFVSLCLPLTLCVWSGTLLPSSLPRTASLALDLGLLSDPARLFFGPGLIGYYSFLPNFTQDPTHFTKIICVITTSSPSILGCGHVFFAFFFLKLFSRILFYYFIIFRIEEIKISQAPFFSL